VLGYLGADHLLWLLASRPFLSIVVCASYPPWLLRGAEVLVFLGQIVFFRSTKPSTPTAFVLRLFLLFPCRSLLIFYSFTRSRCYLGLIVALLVQIAEYTVVLQDTGGILGRLEKQKADF